MSLAMEMDQHWETSPEPGLMADNVTLWNFLILLNIT
jgi:hypothetical protein